MLFLQIYMIVSAIFAVLTIKGVGMLPDGPSNLFSSIMLGLMVGFTWPLGLLMIASEVAGRRNNE